MGLSASGAMQWWDEWQLRVLVLGSLFVQYLLFFSSVVRRRALPSWFRLLFWLAYLGGDALAIYALATLFNRHKQQEQLATGLEVLWAPVLLVHLGGQHLMTAYSIEDNELWRRQAVTMVSQVVVALYVFCKSWPGGPKRLLQAAILLFVVGIFRSIQKPLAMKSVSISNIVASLSLSRSEQNKLALCCETICYCSMGPRKLYVATEGEKAEQKDITLEEFVQKAIRLPELASDQGQAEHKASRDSWEVNVYQPLVDISALYSDRIKNLELFMALDYQHANSMSREQLTKLFSFLYTKLPNIVCCFFCCHFWLPFLILASVILFSTYHKYHDYNATDVKVTYILFWSTALLDFLFLFVSVSITEIETEMVSQQNLLSFYARKKRPTLLMKLATLACCKGYVNMHYYIEHAPATSSHQVVELVHGYVMDGWRRYIKDAASYKRFNLHRGQWALRRQRHLGWSLNMSFDRSVLLWHIATDICFHHQSTTPRGQDCAARSRVISNYMAYLLSIRSEMLIPGSRIGIFTIACEDIERMLGDNSALHDERGLVQGILSRAQQPPLLDDTSITGTAHRLAKMLMELEDESERWEMVRGYGWRCCATLPAGAEHTCTPRT
ncbi:hypothetical protein ACQJBY_066217 [Aegilops geniculata]